MDFSAFCRGLVVFTSPFVFQGGGALSTHYSHYKHVIECRKTRIPGTARSAILAVRFQQKKGGWIVG